MKVNTLEIYSDKPISRPDLHYDMLLHQLSQTAILSLYGVQTTVRLEGAPLASATNVALS